MGIIDTLSAGFSTVNRRLWIIAIPVLLDLFLWLGPKLTAAGPVQRFFDFYVNLSSRSSSELLGQLMSSPEGVDAATQFAKMGERFRDLNFFGVLAWQPPSLMYGQLDGLPGRLFAAPVWSIDRGLVLVGLIFGLALLSLVIQSAYLGAIAQGLRTGESGLSALGGLARRIALNWVRLVAYFIMLLAAAIFLGTPVFILVNLVGLLSPVVASLLNGLLLAVLMWTALYLFFAVAAMFVSDVDPVRAAWYSLNVVRRHFWSALGLILVLLVIRFGLSKIWGLALGNPAGVMTAILGHAYVDAGLAAASMIFYRDRYLLWRSARGGQASTPVDARN